MGREYRAGHTLVLIRHAKSDWSSAVDDRQRPLAPRGLRQAPESGRWLATHLTGDDAIEHAVVSPAQRARSTWDLVAAELASVPPTTVDERAYTFDERGLLAIVRDLPEDWGTVALVGHNPAMEEAVGDLTGSWVAMPTSCLAVIDLPGTWAEATDAVGVLRAHGRPPASGDAG
jgi:phosphohistidine phosphatase